MSWLTWSNALGRSQKATPIWYWFKEVSLLWVRVKIALSIFTPYLKPNCSMARILFDSKCWSNLLNTTISRIFDKAINNDIVLLLLFAVLHLLLLLIKCYNLYKILACSTTFFQLSLFCATFFQLRTFILLYLPKCHLPNMF